MSYVSLPWLISATLNSITAVIWAIQGKWAFAIFYIFLTGLNIFLVFAFWNHKS